jgi:hypothetical protein
MSCALVPARIYRDMIDTPGRLLLLVHVMHHRASAAQVLCPQKRMKVVLVFWTNALCV